MRTSFLAIALAGGLAAIGIGLAGGSAGATGEKPGRYTMSPADGGGFVRLDTETGRMSLCQRREQDWNCREMAEPGGGLNQEIERLRADNQRLKGEIRQMEDILLGDRRAESGPRRGRGGTEFKLPSEEEVDQAMTYMQRMLRKFREKMKEIESDGKGTPL